MLRTAAAGSDAFRYRLLQTETLTRLGEAELRQEHTAVALKHLREAQTVWQTLHAEQPNEFSVRGLDYDLQLVRAEILQARQDFDGALAALRQALAFAEAEQKARPDEVKPLWWLGDCYEQFGKVHEASARHSTLPEAQRPPRESACEWYRKSLQQWDEWPRRTVSSVFNLTRRARVAAALTRCEVGRSR